MAKSNWYALAIQPKKERLVERQLTTAGFEVRAPRYLKTVSHARRTNRVVRPLFPGYLFIRLEEDQHRWREANSLPGAVGVIRFGNRPAVLDSKFVDEFLNNRSGDSLVQIEQNIELGDLVTAVGGPFDRMLGQVIKLSDAERVTVLMDALNRQVETTLSRKSVVIAA